MSVGPTVDDGPTGGASGAVGGDATAGSDEDDEGGRADGAVDGEDDEDDDDDGDDDDGEGEGGGDDGDDASKKAKGKGSKGGSSCHQCKSRRNFVALSYCCATLDKKSKRCRKYTAPHDIAAPTHHSITASSSHHLHPEPTSAASPARHL